MENTNQSTLNGMEEPECMVIEVSPDDVRVSSNEQVRKKSPKKSTKKTKETQKIPANQKTITDFFKKAKTYRQDPVDKYTESCLNNHLSTTTDQETIDRKTSGTNADENFPEEPFKVSLLCENADLFIPNSGSIDHDTSNMIENDTVLKSQENLENSCTSATSDRDSLLENLENSGISTTSYSNSLLESLENSSTSGTSNRSFLQESDTYFHDSVDSWTQRSELFSFDQTCDDNWSNRNTRISEDIILSFLHTVGRYSKKSDQFKELFTEDSKILLSKVATVPDDIKKILSHLYWEGVKPIDSVCKKYKISNWKKYEDMLSQNGIILQNLEVVSDGNDNDTIKYYTDRLHNAHISEIFKSFGLQKPPKNNQVVFDKLKEFCEKQSLKQCVSYDKTRMVIQRLKSTYKTHYYQLSELSRHTFEDLYILMNLNNYKCSRKKGKNNISPGIFLKSYPIDLDIIEENANIVFRDRGEFDRYREACSLYEKWKNATRPDQKDQKFKIIDVAYKSFKEMTEERKERYLSLPAWLREFTPAHIYVDILDESVALLKKSKSYDKAICILDLLIAQVAFKQKSVYEWYAEKTRIMLKNNRSNHMTAAINLINAYEAEVLSEEAVDVLLTSAKSLQEDEKNVDGHLRKKIKEFVKQYEPKHLYSEERFEADQELMKQSASVEDYCGNEYIKKEMFTIYKKCEGRLVNAMFFALFWDIIYTKPVGVYGIFISYSQSFPLDMFSEDFYINRRALIDDRLAMIKKSKEKILEYLDKHMSKIYEYNIPQKLPDNITKEDITSVASRLEPSAVAAICGRLARNYVYASTGFPDLTLYSDDISIKVAFVEVKLGDDRLSIKQKQWLNYMTKNNIDARVCFLQSSTGRLLNDLGVLEHSQRAWQKTLSTSARGYLWLETNAPIYYTHTVEICKPYATLSKDFAFVAAKKAGTLYSNAREYVVAKTPVVLATIEQYAPGLVDNVQSYTASGFEVVKKHYIEYYQFTTEYLKTKVFIGEWAPEILQNKTQTALNVTRSHVSSYLYVVSWTRWR